MNIGLVLSGGGMRGVAHIGVLKALEEHGIVPTHIAGSSAGAIVGAMYAAGIPWSEILHFFKTTTIFSISRYAFNKPGFIDTAKFYNDFKTYFPNDNFSALEKKLFVTATNITDGTLKIFSTGQLIKPLMSSASFPGIFTPTEINGSYYIDGGILNNFPIETLKGSCEKIIGVFVNPLEKMDIKDLNHSYKVIERAFKIKNASEFNAKLTECDVIIYPKELVKYTMFGMNNTDIIFNLGYEAAMKSLKENGGVLKGD